MKQKIYPDPYDVNTWDMESCGSVFVHIINSEQYHRLTGHAPPPTPISAQTYTKYGFPWFDLYDETQGDIAASEPLVTVKTIGDKDAEQGVTPDGNETSVDILDSQIHRLPLPNTKNTS